MLLIDMMEERKMKTTKLSDLHSQFYVYQNQEIRRVFFINSLSLGFIESVASDCEFVDSKNLIFHKSKIVNCSFEGKCQNLIFDACTLSRCTFDKGKLFQIKFVGGTKIDKETTGLPPIKIPLNGLPYSKRR